MREYKTIRALNSGETIDFEGLKLRKAEGELLPGDLYIAERNTGPKLLTCQEVKVNENYVVPKDFPAYCFDIHECVKVEEEIT
jgi:hypothetical protein